MSGVKPVKIPEELADALTSFNQKLNSGSEIKLSKAQTNRLLAKMVRKKFVEGSEITERRKRQGKRKHEEFKFRL